MNILITGIIISAMALSNGCTNKNPKPKPTPEVKPTVKPVVVTQPTLKWHNKEWTEKLIHDLHIYDFNKLSPKDAKEFGITDINSWARFFVEVAKWESNLKPSARYHEPMGMWSRGLFQVSYVDARRYGCEFRNEQDVHDPLKNINCAVRIFYIWIKKDGRIAGRINRHWMGGARYWNVLRGKNSYTKKALNAIKRANSK